MLKKVFLRGLVAVLPIVITCYAVWWFFTSTETLMREVFLYLAPDQGDQWYVPGLGIAVGVGAIFAIGCLLHVWIFNSVYQWATKTLDRLPLVKSIYGMVKDFTTYLGGSGQEEKADQVVTYEAAPGIMLIGFITRSSLQGLPEQLGGEDHIAVYLPMSYQIGGYTIYCSRDKVQTIDMSFEEGMRLAMTAGVSAHKTP